MNDTPLNSSGNLQPEDNKITHSDFISESERLLKLFEPAKHDQILDSLLNQLTPVDFRLLTGIEDESEKLSLKHYLICTIEQILQLAKKNNCEMCFHQDKIYLYNGAYWKQIDEPRLQSFLGSAALKLGVNRFNADYYQFQDHLIKQFFATANLQFPEPNSDAVLINIINGTFQISLTGQFIRDPQAADFLTYQLPFAYDPTANAPMFIKYLNKVLPDKKCQMILAEYLGYLFIRPAALKLEKALILYGSGANGKSVFSDIVNALLGKENVCSFSLQNLTDDKGYHRAMISNKLVNYTSEINGKMDTSYWKQLVSGEPVDARLPYGSPFTMTNYAKLIFNCNELPQEVEHTNAYFRRFLLIPFEVMIPIHEQDKELSKKIIANELPGVFNWVFDGLKRLLREKQFTSSETVDNQLERYKKESDSVLMFLQEEEYEKSTDRHMKVKELYPLYKAYCSENGYRPCSNKKFCERMKNAGYTVERKNFGNAIYVQKTL